MAHKWQPIEDVRFWQGPGREDSAYQASMHAELHDLAAIWNEQKGSLDSQQINLFNEKLNREWAIETGLIERIYYLDRGVTQTLIERGIDERRISLDKNSPPGQTKSEVAAILIDQKAVVEGLFDFVKGGRDLTVGYIKEVHAALLRNQEYAVGVDQFGNKVNAPLLRGKYKELANNPVTSENEMHEYCPPEHTASEMDQLVALHLEHVRLVRVVPPLLAAAWLHHRFTQIHPFQDGNGRVARCLATLVFIKAGWFPLVVRTELKSDYIDALEEADAGDLSALIQFFARIQRKFFIAALDIADAIRQDPEAAEESPPSAYSHIIQRAAKKLQRSDNETPEMYEAVEVVAAGLNKIARRQFESTGRDIQKELGDQVKVWVEQVDQSDRISFYEGTQILETDVETLDNRGRRIAHSTWVKLAIEPPKCAEIDLIFSHEGRHPRGIMACSASFAVREKKARHGIRNAEFWMLSDEAFFFNYEEPQDQTEQRFKVWLDQVIAKGLEHWQEQL